MAEGFDPNAPCRSCGRQAAGPSADPRRQAPGAVPDLDFGGAISTRQVVFRDEEPAAPPPVEHARPPPRATPADRAMMRAQSANIDMGRGAVFEADDDAFGGGNLSLELDVKPGAPVRGGAMAPTGLPMQQGHVPSVHPPGFRPIAAGVADRRPSEAPVATFEAKVLGAFGEPPKHFWQAPMYAWRVRTRLRELRHLLEERTKAAERAAAQLDQSLVALGQRARGTAERNPAYGRTLDTLRLHEATLRQRDSALMTEMDGHNRQLNVIDQKISEMQQQVAIAQAEERRIADELAMAQATIQRAEAKLKRLDIELRSAFGPNENTRRGGS
jgi:hypothetical protein